MMTKTAVRTTSAPAPAHAFPQGVRTGPFVQVSGQGPVDPATGEYVHRGDVAAQTRRTLANVAAIIEAAGATFADVISLRVYLTDREHFAAMNEAYADFVAERSEEHTSELQSRGHLVGRLLLEKKKRSDTEDTRSSMDC